MLNKNFSVSGGGSKRPLIIGIVIAAAVLLVAAIVVVVILVSNKGGLGGIFGNKEQPEEIQADTINQIQVVSNPSKRQYFCNEPFDQTGLEVYAFKQSGSYIILDPDEYTITGFDSSVAVEHQVLTVTYKGFTDTFTVTIKEPFAVEPTLESITMGTLPKTLYKVAEGLNTKGGTFICTYSDGTTKTVELSNKHVTGFRVAYEAGVGEYELTVTYTEKTTTVTTTYKITITE